MWLSPIGTFDTFTTYGGPANLLEAANTIGLPLYARQHLDEKGRWIDLMTEACNVAHRAYIFDNSGSKHKLLADVEESAGEVTIKLHASRLNPWFVNTELWRSFS